MLHCYHQNYSCIKMGGNENHFHVSLIVRDKIIRPCPQTTTLKRKESKNRIKQGPSAYEPNALLLIQTGS